MFSLPRFSFGAIVGATLVVAAAGQQAFPLPQAAGDTTAAEATAPFLLPVRMTQTLVADRNSLLQGPGLPAGLARWDMVGTDPSGRFLFVPCEMDVAGGLFRYDRQTGAVQVILQGNGTTRTASPTLWNAGNDEYARIDPATWTPWGTLLTAEEAYGGRVFEVMNPLSNGPFVVRWLDRIPGSAHEGLRLDAAGTLYFIDEYVSGSIYRYVPTVPGDLSNGQTFVLRVDGWNTTAGVDATLPWNDPANVAAPRTGAATWVPITDQSGAQITPHNPFAYVTAAGARITADEVNGTPFGRPEDLDVVTLANGATCLLVSITDEHVVLSIEMTGTDTAMVRHFVDQSTIDMATGAPIGAEFFNPDNIAIDALGGIYLVEDYWPGDLFKAFDDDHDGVAERMGRFASLGVAGAEPTGLSFSPVDPYRMLVVVQHPASGNTALWELQSRPYQGNGETYVRVVAGVDGEQPSSGPVEFTRSLSAGQQLTLAVTSAPGVLAGAPYALALQPFVTAQGTGGYLWPFWLDPFGFTIVASAGAVASQAAGNAVTLPIPGGLAGLSVMTQAVVLAPGTLVLTDGIELVLR